MESRQAALPRTNALTLSAEAVRKSGRVLFAFSSFYLPAYDLPADFMFSRYDVFGYLSAAIYEIDEQVEVGASYHKAANQLDTLAGYLAERIRIDAKIESLFEDAKEYYRFEDRVLGRDAFDFSDVIANASRRSFDFRLMHRALVQLKAWDYDELLFDWFRKFEMKMEVEDDLQSFDEDLTRGTFNTACLVARVAGGSAPALVEAYREELDEGIEKGLRTLSEAQKQRCGGVLSRYREIVPRPLTPSLSGNREHHR